MTSPMRFLAAVTALVAVVGGGALLYAAQGTSPSPPAPTETPIRSRTPSPTALPSPSAGQNVLGWPSTSGSGPGLYSWDPPRCAGTFCNVGFMHNGYGAGDVAIIIRMLADEPVVPEATATTIAGHHALYRRFTEPDPSPALGPVPAPLEVWIVDFDGALLEIAIRPDADSGATDAGLADAHAIIASLRYDPEARGRAGFRLIFQLTNAEWDSG